MNEIRNTLVLKLEYRGGTYGNLWQLENLFTGDKKKLYTDYSFNNQYERITNFISIFKGIKNISILMNCKEYYLILCELDLSLTNFALISEEIKKYRF